ncbi:hypothetical protein SAMN05421737_11168 [Shouchella lonarensis]|uniref:Uncharacterized protein n=1 Tax=Shouchella lonarensis TaxID=1464122 RepID=A0A1G6N2Y8_9BACI|nr:hypothetical protein SAMN05421737_11168 [Shouchella lonarensis]
MNNMEYSKNQRKWLVYGHQESQFILKSNKFRTPRVDEISSDTPSFFLALTIA